MAIRRSIRTLQASRVFTGTIYSYLGDRVDVMLSGRLVRNIPLNGGPPKLGQTVRVDYSSGKPIASSIGIDTIAPVASMPKTRGKAAPDPDLGSAVPDAHTHTESQITDLLHNAEQIMGTAVEDPNSNMGDGTTMIYRAQPNDKLEWEFPYIKVGDGEQGTVDDIIRINFPSGTVTFDGLGTCLVDTSAAATDGNAIHDNETNEIHAIANKNSPADDDVFIIENSFQNTWDKYSVKWSQLKVHDPMTLAMSTTLGWYLIGQELFAEVNVDVLNPNEMTSGLASANTVPVANGLGAINWTVPSILVEEADGSPSITTWKMKFPNGSITDNGGGIITLDFSGSNLDPNAVHVNSANEISGLTEKTTLSSNDLLIVEDSDNGYVKKKVKASNVGGGQNPGGGSSVLEVQVFS